MDYDGYLRFIMSLAFVVGLIFLMAWGLRRYGFGVILPRPGGARRTRRLSVVEVAPLDTKRRLILVRRDEVEHLVMIGGATDVVIEAGIAAGGFAGALARVPTPDGEPHP